VKKALRTQTRSAALDGVFSSGSDKELHALVASLCVLFEDLRIEIAGQVTSHLEGLDECGAEGRRLYFLRRSMVTLHEFSTVLYQLDQLSSFQPIRARFDPLAETYWARAISYFRKYDAYIARLRHHVGGHFGQKAAELAIKNLSGDSVGAIEVAFYVKGAGAKLLFAKEVVATGTLRHVPGKTIPEKARRLVRHAVVAYRKAAWAVDCVTKTYLWDRFGLR